MLTAKGGFDMARSIWKGSISFGLLNVPVTLYPAEQRNDISFHLIDSRDHARVRYQRINEDTGEEVSWSEIVKAFNYEDGSYVLMTDEDLAAVAIEASQTVEIQAFVPREAIDIVYFDKPYYLEPGKRGEKGYALLREVLTRTGRVGIARVVIRTREYLAALVPWGDALVLELLRYHQELRDVSALDLPGGTLAEYKISKKELEMAESLLEAMSTDWDPASFTDEYRTKLREYIESKADGKDHVPIPETADAEPTKIIDIMEVLKRSLAQKGNVRKTAGKAGKATAATKVTAKKVAKKTAKKTVRKPAGKTRKKTGAAKLRRTG